MKKSILFVSIIMFLVSVFLISSFGGAIRDDQFKNYFTNVEILTYEEDTYEQIGIKIYRVMFDAEAGETKVSIDYKVNPVDATDSSAYAFSIVDGNEQFDIGDDEHTMKDCATLEKNILAFYHPVSVRVMLKTTDGSDLSDFCTFICVNPEPVG